MRILTLWKSFATISLLTFTLFETGCCNRCNQEVSRYHEDGRSKPVVAIASMIDTTSFDACWSLSEELTATIATQVAKDQTIYVTTQDDFPFAENPFGSTDFTWMKREFPEKEFVVFSELVEHDLTAAKNKKNIVSDGSTHLNMAVRLRVIDLRPQTPYVVLQETIRDSYFIPKTLLPTDYASTVWGSEDYRKSPMGIAHAQLSSEIAHRVSDYILLAKSR